MRSLQGKHIWSLFILVGLFVVHSITFANDLDVTKAGVVKITTTTGQTGTGFIVRVEPEVVYIITAAHVIVGDNQPEVEFFTKRNLPVNGAVMPGAEVNDDLRGLALVVVRGKASIPSGLSALPFGTSADLVSGGEDALVIGHSGGGGNWAILKRNISNRVGRDISLDPGVASRFSGGPIFVNNKIVGIVMSNRDGFGLGITHKSVLSYIEGFIVVPSAYPIVDESKSASSTKPQVPTGQVEPPLSVSSRQLIKTKTGKDGAPMVLVSAGEFTMGSPEEEGDIDEHPQQEVYLKDFYIDQYEVTVERFQRFMKGKNRSVPEYWDQVELRRDAQKPVVGIDWNDAKAYCEWAGKRLPTEAEWEKAARGTDIRIYPWGNDSPNSSTANFGKDWNADVVYSEKLKVAEFYERGKSPYGAYDMAGNVSEWVVDWYDKDYYQVSPEKNPKGPSSGDLKVIRGGSWRDNSPNLRSAERSWGIPTTRYAALGVRCAQDVPSANPTVGESKSVLPTMPIAPTGLVKPPASVSREQLPKTKSGKDGAPMVLVPAGKFTMGKPDGEGSKDEHPQHTVDLAAFYIDQYEVTVERYDWFMKKMNPPKNTFWDEVELKRDGQKPVVGIDWHDAQFYCEWAGKRLPTEAEWEKAARGTDKRTYPWGATKPNSSTANFGKSWDRGKTYAEKLKAVGSSERGKSPYGAYDMVGNVLEWVADSWAKDYYQNSPQKNPQGPSSGRFKVMRGGSWKDHPSRLESADRFHNTPNLRKETVGFRCAQDAP